VAVAASDRVVEQVGTRAMLEEVVASPDGHRSKLSVGRCSVKRMADDDLGWLRWLLMVVKLDSRRGFRGGYEQLSPFSQLEIPIGFHVIKFETKSKLNLPQF
jgi:hypothetical protein